MAHPKLAAAVNRSVLTASTVALLAGPLAVAGSAQTLDGVTDSAGEIVEDLTCEQAKETEDELLIEKFCPEEEDGKDGGGRKGDKGGKEDSRDPVDEVANQVEQTAKDTVDDIAPSDDEGDEEGGGEEEPAPTEVLPTGGGDGDGGKKPGSRDVGKAGSEDPQPIHYDSSATGTSGSTSGSGAADGAGYSTTGGLGSGLASQSALTLQPFAAPLVSVPPVYEFPQIAEQLFSDDAAATAGNPVAADGTVTPSTDAVNAYNSNGFAATSADPTGWLAATATGLIMLLGAAHALNGGRTPRRAQA